MERPEFLNEDGTIKDGWSTYDFYTCDGGKTWSTKDENSQVLLDRFAKSWKERNVTLKSGHEVKVTRVLPSTSN